MAESKEYKRPINIDRLKSLHSSPPPTGLNAPFRNELKAFAVSNKCNFAVSIFRNLSRCFLDYKVFMKHAARQLREHLHNASRDRHISVRDCPHVSPGRTIICPARFLLRRNTHLPGAVTDKHKVRNLLTRLVIAQEQQCGSGCLGRRRILREGDI